MVIVKFAVEAVLLWACVCNSEGWLMTSDSRSKVCYGIWGCFHKKSPFNDRPLPRAPRRLGVQFKLHTGLQQATTISINETRDSLRSMNVFDSTRPTKVIIHGYQDNAQNSWVSEMVQSLLAKEPMNVFVVDWGKGASFFDYFQTCSDARLVGRIIARLLKTLIATGANPGTFHLIGHSLGAHIAGFAAESIPGVGRITGLDPAGPSFERISPSARLDPSDANFVDVIHTDSEPLVRLGLGMKMASGHVDFYPNGGLNQPGCPSDLSQVISRLLSGQSFIYSFGCSHMRAIYLFTESINSSCQFKSRPCPNVSSISPSSCTDCLTNCVRMGYHADAKQPSGVFYLATNEQKPYCKS